jgi:hypothetical protein
MLFVLLAVAASAGAQAKDKAKDKNDEQSGAGLTIYNQQFAVVRETIPLELTAGTTRVSYSEITAHAEPESVLLRDLRGGALRVLEQNYRNDAASQALLLSKFEGQELDFLQSRPDGPPRVVRGKLIRSGYVPHMQAYSRYSQQYQMQQQAMYSGVAGQPIVEVDGKLQFSLPGEPVFPPFPKDTILKPTFDWLLATPQAGAMRAELSYITGGMMWNADYNVVAPEKGDDLNIVGWVTLDNQSGRTFENARIKLMAGDVNKLLPQYAAYDGMVMAKSAAQTVEVAGVTEKAFDEYHLYSLPRITTLRDRETKQVEFLRAEKVPSQRLYVYDGARISQQYYGYGYEYRRNQPDYGVLSNNKVWAMREFKNAKANNLGMPIPKGRLRFYRRDTDGQLEFIGESDIDHTPEDETIRVYTGNAFDIFGERKRETFNYDSSKNFVDESFQINVRNHKAEPVEVRVVEHLYRWNTWEIKQRSDEFRKIDSNTVEFRVTIPPKGEKVVTYQVHYSW